VAAVLVGLVGLAILGYQIALADFDLAVALPLQLCDIATAAAVTALWTRDPRAAAFTYYVGLSLTIQAVLTPSVATTFPSPEFFGFWGLHVAVVWTAAYLTWGLGLRPDWRLYRFSLLATIAWAAVAMGFNAVAGTNYGYLRWKPATATLLDLMGPWPWYVLVATLTVAAVWAVFLTLPWRLVERRSQLTPEVVRRGAAPTGRAPHRGPPRPRRR
jgi:hypothetical integral membrane protein (TIGR02206 family)